MKKKIIRSHQLEAISVFFDARILDQCLRYGCLQPPKTTIELIRKSYVRNENAFEHFRFCFLITKREQQKQVKLRISMTKNRISKTYDNLT